MSGTRCRIIRMIIIFLELMRMVMLRTEKQVLRRLRAFLERSAEEYLLGAPMVLRYIILCQRKMRCFLHGQIWIL